jgi:hypothetical protein
MRMMCRLLELKNEHAFTQVKAEAESYQEIKLYGCDVKDEYHIMRFLGHPPRLADVRVHCHAGS